MPRAYGPRLATLDLVADILARPGVAKVLIIAPRRNGRRPTMLRITLDGPGGVYSDFSLADARAWLAADKAADR